MPDYTYTSDGTWVCPDGWRKALVECLGGGGSGHPWVTSIGPGGGGRGGDLAYSIVDVVPGQSYDVVVGIGGTGIDEGDLPTGAESGTSSIFGDRLVLGAGGFASTGTDGGGVGVEPSIGDTIVEGIDGQPRVGDSFGVGGAGAPPYGGAGGISEGEAGHFPGGGGAGARDTSGGNGAPGLIYITFVATDTPVVRLYPRDDGRGMSSAPRIWPPAKGRSRVIGGYQ